MSDYLTHAEAAERLGISQRKLGDLRRAGKIGYIGHGYCTIRYTQDQLDAYVESCRVEPKGRRTIEKPPRVVMRTHYKCIPMDKPKRGA